MSETRRSALRTRLEDVRGNLELSPQIDSIVTETLTPSAWSLPLAFATTTADAVSSAPKDRDPSDGRTGEREPGRMPEAEDDPVLAVETALIALGTYARLRSVVLDHDRNPTDRERDDAILASDYFHAAAHASLAPASLPPTHLTECYRVLTAGSATLASRFYERSGADRGSGADFESDSDLGSDRRDATERRRPDDAGSPSPTPILVEIGCALGAAAACAPRETVDAMGTYGRSVMAAVSAVSSTTPHTGDEPRSDRADETASEESPFVTVERILTGERTDLTDAVADSRMGSPSRIRSGRALRASLSTRHRPGPLAAGAESDGNDGDIESGDEVETGPETDLESRSEADNGFGLALSTDAIVAHLERARATLETLPGSDSRGASAPRMRLEAATFGPLVDR